MNTTELIARNKELASLMTERARLNPVSCKLLNEEWRKDFPDEVAVARRILALVEALESAQKSNAFLKDQLSELANFNPDWDKLEASYEIWREIIVAELLAAKGRIAELEGRAVKFPPKVERDDSDGYWMLKGQRVSAANAAYYNEALKDVALALFAAGIKCEVKGS